MCIPTRARRHVAICFAAVCLSVLCTAQPGAAQAPYSRIVVFGDSLSDTGNGFAVTHTNATPPDYSLDGLFIPDAPYARGGHHLSNGATWIEYLARPLGLAGSVQPAFRSSTRNATNYAVGTVRARDEAQNVSLADQVEVFLAEFGGLAPADALYVIELGSNDVRDALMMFPVGSADILAAAVGGIAEAIATLHAAGARHILVWDVPNIALTPAVRIAGAQDPLIPVIASTLTTTFNTALADAVSLLTGLPGINLILFPASELVTAIVADPSAFGLVDVENPCVMPNTPPFACRNPDEFLFWDGIHATTAVHAIVAREVALLLGL